MYKVIYTIGHIMSKTAVNVLYNDINKLMSNWKREFIRLNNLYMRHPRLKLVLKFVFI